MNPDRIEQYKRTPKTRLTIVATILHQASGQDPIPLEIRQQRGLETDEQPYIRHLILPPGNDWLPLDIGWLNKGVSCISIKNNEGTNFTRIPSQAQKDEINTRVIEISFDGINPHIEVRPGEVHPPIFVVDVSKVKIRVRNGTAKASIIAFPK